MRIKIPADIEPMIFIWTGIGSPVLRSSLGSLTAGLAVNDSTITPKEREAIRYYLAYREDCNACKSSRFGIDRPEYAGLGMTEEWYDNIADYQTAPGFTDRERLVIEFSSRLFDDHRDLEQDDDLWQRMGEWFTQVELEDLTILSSMIVGMNRIREVLLGPGDTCTLQPAAAVAAANGAYGSTER